MNEHKFLKIPGKKIKWKHRLKNAFRFNFLLISGLVIISYIAILSMLVLGVEDWSDLRFWIVMGAVASIYVRLMLLLRADYAAHPW